MLVVLAGYKGVMLVILAVGALMYNLMRGWMYDFGIRMVVLIRMALAEFTRYILKIMVS